MSLADRRKNRSSDATEAANLYLSAAAKRRAFRALALANPEGEVVAEANSGVSGAALAAIAPFADEGTVPVDGLLQFVTGGQSVRLWNLNVDGHQLHLMGVGGSHVARSQVENDLQRILSEEDEA